jgi:uncharacterized lipoprotein YajG
MKLKAFLLLTFVAITGCAGMSPEQLKASEGMATCTTTTNVWGTVSVVTHDVRNTRKGATSENSTEILCGNAKMVIGDKVGVPVPLGATTVTTTTVTPVKPQ